MPERNCSGIIPQNIWTAQIDEQEDLSPSYRWFDSDPRYCNRTGHPEHDSRKDGNKTTCQGKDTAPRHVIFCFDPDTSYFFYLPLQTKLNFYLSSKSGCIRNRFFSGAPPPFFNMNKN